MEQIEAACAFFGSFISVFFQWIYASTAYLFGSIKTFSQENSEVMPLIGASVAAIFTGIIALISLRINAAVNIRNKRMDTILKCSDRYNALYEMKKEIEKNLKFIECEIDESSNQKIYFLDPQRHELKSYFRIFWGLKSDQLDYWLAGYIDPETLASWVVTTVENLENLGSYDENSATIRLLDSIPEMNKIHGAVNKNLVDMVAFCIDYVVPIDGSDARYAAVLHYLRILERNEKNFINLLSRNSFRRVKVSSVASTISEKQRQEYHNLNTQFVVTRIVKGTLSFLRWIVVKVFILVTLSKNDTREKLKERIKYKARFRHNYKGKFTGKPSEFTQCSGAPSSASSNI